jgi:hypothetical protein
MLSWIWDGIARSEGALFKLLRCLLLVGGLCWGYLFISLPLTWRGQTVLGLLMVAAPAPRS